MVHLFLTTKIKIRRRFSGGILVEIKHHFIREAVKNNSLDIQHLATTEMLADILTKALPAPQFLKLRHSILDHT